MRTMIQYTGKVLSAGLLSIGILCGCAQTEIENRFSESGDDSVGQPVAFSIGVADTPEYNAETDGTPATRSGKPLLDEWGMELVEDTVSCTPQTRGMMRSGYYFRLIAFKKSGTGYVYHAAADYVVKGANAPELKQGTMDLSSAATYRFLAYSFNNAKEMGALPSSYTWNSTSVSIPDLNSDFLTFDSGDQYLSSASFFLPVKFIHQLCKLTVKISVTGFASNTFSNCTGVYIAQGGNSSSWTVGASAIDADTDNTASFNIKDNSTTTSTRLVPFSAARPITVHFGTLTVGGKAANNKEITSSQSVRLLAGRSYTMTVQFEKVYELTKPTNGYVQIGKYKWAYANLNYDKTMESNPWVSGQQGGGSKDNDYWRWNMLDVDTSADTPSSAPNTWDTSTDPCRTMGSSWKIPPKEYFNDLVKYVLVSKKVSINGVTAETDASGWVSSGSVAGCVFADDTRGTCIFLPAAGRRSGSSYYGVGTEGYYWSVTRTSDSNFAYYLSFYSGYCYVANYGRSNSYSLRCAQ